MRWSITVGKIAGTSIHIHATFLFFLFFIGFVIYRANGPTAALDTLAFVTLIFLCVLLHEFGHILMAKKYGIKTRDVTLFPIGGVASIERMPERPGQELLVALAGPTVNLVIAVVILTILNRPISLETFTQMNPLEASLALRIAVANLILMAFNLIPAFPMDGGRVLRALLALRLGKTQATRIAAGIGQALSLILGIFGFLGNPMLIFIAIFIFIAAGAEAENTTWHDASSDLSVCDATLTSLEHMKAADAVSAIVDQLVHSTDNDFAVVDEIGMPIGIVTRNEILSALRSKKDAVLIGSLMIPANIILTETDPLEKALDLFETSNSSALLVSDSAGGLAGIVTRVSIAQLMLILTARPGWKLHRGGMLAKSLPQLSRDRREASL